MKATVPLLLLLLLLPAAAAAQPSQYFYPVESALLERHIDLQFEYAQPAMDPLVHRTVLSVEGQVVLADRLELSLDVPFLYYSFTDADNATVLLDPAQVGDFILGIKVVTTRSARLSTAAFVNTRLPLHSGLKPRNYTTFQTGGAVTLSLGRALFGGTVEVLWFLRTADESRDMKGRDAAHIGIGLHASYRLYGPLSVRLALQFYNSMHPDAEIQIVGLSPGLSLELPRGLSLELGTRIAPTNESRDLFGGRASVIVAAGWRF